MKFEKKKGYFTKEESNVHDKCKIEEEESYDPNTGISSREGTRSIKS